jgi:hypothetical protein
VLSLSQSDPSSSQTLASSQPTAASQVTIVAEDSDEAFDVATLTEVPKDDHYLDYRAVIVGIQYYKGQSVYYLSRYYYWGLERHYM